MSVKLPRFPWPYARVGSSFHCGPGTAEEDLYREWCECCDDPFWWNSGRGRFVVQWLDRCGKGLGGSR